MSAKYGFQNPVTPIMYGISMLHDHILFFLALILFVVLFIFVVTLRRFNYMVKKWPLIVRFQKTLFFFSDGEEIKARIFAGSGRKDDTTEGWIWSKINSGVLVEIVWTIIPSIILLLIAIPSFALLFAIDEIAVSKILVKVIGHQWYWSYEVTGLTNEVYKTAFFDSYMLADSDLKKGELRLLKTDNPLILPKNTPICILITSDDVLHSWAVPSFGVKVDAIPGRLSQISLVLKNSGIFTGQCSELCGVNHGFMPIEIWVVDLFTYARLELFLKETLKI